MSMANCHKCGEFIDTDEDPDSTYFDMKFICEDCRQHLTLREQAEHEKLLNAEERP